MFVRHRKPFSAAPGQEQVFNEIISNFECMLYLFFFLLTISQALLKNQYFLSTTQISGSDTSSKIYTYPNTQPSRTSHSGHWIRRERWKGLISSILFTWILFLPTQCEPSSIQFDLNPKCQSLFWSFFFFKQKTAYEMLRSLVGSEMCIRDRYKKKRPKEALALRVKIKLDWTGFTLRR